MTDRRHLNDGRARLRPLAELPAPALQAVRCLLSDIDDTLTTDGRLTAAAYAAVERLAAAGIAVVPVTGRPAGWCDHIARMWPVAGVVGENGAFYFAYDRPARRMIRRYWRDEAARHQARARLDLLGQRILAAVPEARIAADQPYREADLAIDFAEDVGPLPAAAIDRIVALFQAEGAEAKVSSIHVNGWFGDFDKLAMTRVFAAERLGLDLDQALESFAFIGDSPNDQPMFGFFPLSVGVANVVVFRDRLDTPPAFVTPSRSGAGFVELAERLLAER